MSKGKSVGSIPLGGLKFDAIAYTDELIATAVENFVIVGSKRGTVSVSDINIYSITLPPPERYSTVKEGLEQGNRLFDMLMYFSIPEHERPKIRAVTTGDSPDVISEGDIARAMFFLAFYLLTRANVPKGDTAEIGTVVPAFLNRIMGCTEAPDHYMDQLATFNLSKMSHGWIRHIKWSSIGQEALNRLGLGVAGYRLTTPFKLLTPKEGLSATEMQAYRVALSFAQQPPDWTVHPVTRDPNVLRKYGNLNKNFENLMNVCFTQEDLQLLVNQKTLFKMPEVNPQHTDWRSWTADFMFVGNDPIFRS